MRSSEKKLDENVVRIVVLGFAGNLLLALVFAYFVVAESSKRLTILFDKFSTFGQEIASDASALR